MNNEIATLLGQRDGRVPNRAGGLNYATDKWQRLQRWLILGSENGTYYVGASQLTLENAQIVVQCLRDDPQRTVQIITDISREGRAFKNDHAIFALAIAASPNLWYQGGKTWNPVYDLRHVIRTGSHLLQFVSYVDELRGWGTSLRELVGGWFLNQEVDHVAYQVTKYGSRTFGSRDKKRGKTWSMRDVLRLAHPKPRNNAYNALFQYIVAKDAVNKDKIAAESGIDYISAVELSKASSHNGELVALIDACNLPWEVVQQNRHGLANDAAVKSALLQRMPLTALIRQLGSYTADGLLEVGSDNESVVLSKLGNVERIGNARIHPMNLFIGMLTYQSGSGIRGSNTWKVNKNIVNALEEAFYASFKTAPVVDRSVLIGIDVSTSMRSSMTTGVVMNAARAASAQALVLANTIKNAEFMTFNKEATPFAMNKSWTLEKAFSALNIGGGTDCSAIIRAAIEQRQFYDAFVVLTDNEHWHGSVHPYDAFNTYRSTVNPNAKLVTVAMTSDGTSLARPDDVNCIDCVGFDTNTPQIISQFLNDEL